MEDVVPISESGLTLKSDTSDIKRASAGWHLARKIQQLRPAIEWPAWALRWAAATGCRHCRRLLPKSSGVSQQVGPDCNLADCERRSTHTHTHTHPSPLPPSMLVIPLSLFSSPPLSLPSNLSLSGTSCVLSLLRHELRAPSLNGCCQESESKCADIRKDCRGVEVVLSADWKVRDSEVSWSEYEEEPFSPLRGTDGAFAGY